MRHGQILVLVLLVVVVALAIGLSIASRNITNLRTSTQTNQSQRSFSAAEGGVEDVLSKLNAVNNLIVNSGAPAYAVPGCSFTGVGQAKCDITVGDIVANVNITALPNYESVVELGDVGQVLLEGATGLCLPPACGGSRSKIHIDWVSSGVPSETGDPASVEFTLLRLNPAGNLTQSRSAYSPIGRIYEDGFSGTTGCVPTLGFGYCAEINWPTGTARLLRIKPFWNKATVLVTIDTAGAALPTQVYDVTSTASTELGITRRVQVTRTREPQVPAVFDYALYSESGITK